MSREKAGEVLRLDEQRVPKLDDHIPNVPDPQLAGAVWSILEREPDYGDEHGPARLAFLHVKCEAAWLFWNLWLRRISTPPPFAIIVAPEYRGSIVGLFGTNGAAYQLEGGRAMRPDWILYKRPASELQAILEAEWPEYEVAASEEGGRSMTLLRRRPDTHRQVVEAHLRRTDAGAHAKWCLERGVDIDVLGVRSWDERQARNT